MEPTPERVKAVTEVAKTTRKVLTPEEIDRVIDALERPRGA